MKMSEIELSRLKKLLQHIVNDNAIHAQWLNTLSLMENTGARKISRFQHPEKVDIIILKHAAEEARHAFFLKKNIQKLTETPYQFYSSQNVLAWKESAFYLPQLDIDILRYFKKQMGFVQRQLHHAAYLFTTLAIEIRASSLYPLYQEVLDEVRASVNVKSIIMEEKGHLNEMENMLDSFLPEWREHLEAILALENRLYRKWVDALEEVV